VGMTQVERRHANSPGRIHGRLPDEGMPNGGYAVTIQWLGRRRIEDRLMTGARRFLVRGA
jgi:hypothetical protein